MDAPDLGVDANSVVKLLASVAVLAATSLAARVMGRKVAKTDDTVVLADAGPVEAAVFRELPAQIRAVLDKLQDVHVVRDEIAIVRAAAERSAQLQDNTANILQQIVVKLNDMDRRQIELERKEQLEEARRQGAEQERVRRRDEERAK